VKYSVIVEGIEHDVEVTDKEVRLDGRPLDARLVAIPQTPLRQLVLNGAARTYAMIDSADGWVVLSGGRISSVSVEDERTQRLRSMAGAQDRGDHGGVVKAPMPGLVIRVEVQIGQKIEPGAGVVVLEAMKMENEITAGSGGVVSGVRVEAGQAVDKGSVLIELAPG
jgi:biotin carboxyl carrier protein